MTPIAHLPQGVLNGLNPTIKSNGDRKATTVNFAAVDPKLTTGYDPTKAPTNAAKPAGVLGASYTPAMAKVVDAVGTGYGATKNVVNDNSMSAYHLGKITESGSPLMQQAETTGLKFANKRGLLNSSIAAGAVQDSVIRNATPLATQDANTYANSNLSDQAAINRASEFGAAAANTASLQNAQAGTQVNITNAGALNNKGAMEMSNAHSMELARIQADTTLSVADKQILSNQLIAKNENENKLTLQQMGDQTQQKIAALQANTSLSVAERQQQTQQLIADKDNKTKMELQAIQSSTALTAEDKRAASNAAIAAGDNNTKILLQATANAANLGLAELDVNTKLQISNMDIASKAALAKLGIESDQLIRTNASAAGLMQQAMINIGTIATSTMDGPAKQAATDNILNTLRNGLDSFEVYGTMDLSRFFPTAQSAAAATPTAPVTPGIGGAPTVPGYGVLGAVSGGPSANVGPNQR